VRVLAGLVIAMLLGFAAEARAEMRGIEVTGGSATVQFDNTLWQAGRNTKSGSLVFECIHADCGKGSACFVTTIEPQASQALDPGSLLLAIKSELVVGAVFPGGKVVSIMEPPRTAMVGDNMGVLITMGTETDAGEVFDVQMFQTGADEKLIHSVSCRAPAGLSGAWERETLMGGLKFP
jgi:hypothetical protein